MKKLLILSGKGGTGKTTTATSFIRFSNADAIADCDVDAPNLHIVSGVKTEPATSDFMGSNKAFIDPDKCIGCGKCSEHCRFDAIKKENHTYSVIDYACEGCGVCTYVCPTKAVSMNPDKAGTLSLYKEENRVFSTASLRMGRGNSGLLVTQVKSAMTKAAPDARLAIIDGSPGIGCPVIASVTGVDLVLIVAEPSLSGLSDLTRILKTTSILGTKAAVCINKYDVSPDKTQVIEAFCRENDIPFLGKIPYDSKASQAINEGKSIADYDCPARDALWEVYVKTMELLGVNEA